jgi:hypothetical protein
MPCIAAVRIDQASNVVTRDIGIILPFVPKSTMAPPTTVEGRRSLLTPKAAVKYPAETDRVNRVEESFRIMAGSREPTFRLTAEAVKSISIQPYRGHAVFHRPF